MASRTARGTFIVRFETKDGIVKWREVKSLDGKTLCEAAGLSPLITRFDVASGFESGGGVGRQGRKLDGIILQGFGADERPIGTVTLVQQSEKFPDVDPVAAFKSLGCEVDEGGEDRWRAGE